MSLLLTKDTLRGCSSSSAEIYRGEICQEKSRSILQELGFPRGFLPLEDIEECGFDKGTGFIWLKQKQKKQHKFEKIGKFAHYGTEITAYAEPKKLKRVTGIMAKELFMWITVNEVNVDEDFITFKTPTGLYRAFPAEAFELEH